MFTAPVLTTFFRSDSLFLHVNIAATPIIYIINAIAPCCLTPCRKNKVTTNGLIKGEQSGEFVPVLALDCRYRLGIITYTDGYL